MKILVLSGPGEVSKRTQMLKIKQQFSESSISTYDLSSDKLSEINLAISSQSLFSSSEKLIIAENSPDDIDLKKMVKQNNPATLLFLTKSTSQTSKLLFSAKEIKAKIINFEPEKETLVFPYLDDLIEGKKEAFLELEKLLSEYGGMYVLTMIYYLLRRNFLPSSKSTFMQKKIKSQKQKFTRSDWQRLYFMSLKSDFAIKSGSFPENIALIKLTEEFISYC